MGWFMGLGFGRGCYHRLSQSISFFDGLAGANLVSLRFGKVSASCNESRFGGGLVISLVVYGLPNS